MSSRLAYLLISKRTHDKVLRELYCQIHIETSNTAMLRSLSTTLWDKPELGEYIDTLSIEQSVVDDPAGMQFKPLEQEDKVQFYQILACCRPTKIYLHLFETPALMLSLIQADLAEHLELCVRYDASDLPEPLDASWSGEVNPNPWLDIIHRASNTLTSLVIGGRLLDIDVSFDDLERDLPTCRALVTLRDLHPDHAYLLAQMEYYPGFLLDMLIQAHSATLETLDMTTLVHSALECLRMTELPKIKTLHIPLLADSFEEVQSVMTELRKYPTLETLHVNAIFVWRIRDALYGMEAAISDDSLPNLKTIRLPLKSKYSEEVEEHKDRLEEICRAKNIQISFSEEEL